MSTSKGTNMKAFFPASVKMKEEEKDYLTFFDHQKVKFVLEDDATHPGSTKGNTDSFVEFSLDDPGTVLHSRGVPVEDIEQLSFFLRDNQDIMKAELKGQWVEVTEDTDRLYETPQWLTFPWVNLSQVCLKLYGKKDKSTTAYFTLKRQNKRPWKMSELEKLEEIRQEFARQMSSAAANAI